ncbi:unnamed protein product [Rotaria magnacalcarata]|uniref:Cupin type-1 domain-containing protein n=1 Tax=Rotaria magnacalcarata TaxID=392030 RepID=A0A816W896_9BILA|nr:unnamed protein product [Rotaria magnacalcarata]CAF4157655.1 unnamed protein product [Rotaria magnacalcarata]
MIFSSNGANVTSQFTFPDVKSDPYPVLVQGPAGELFNFTKIGYSTNNTFALAYATLPPNAGPFPHIHHYTNEWFYFPKGGIVIFSSNQTYPNENQIPNGVQLPKTSMHRYHTKPGDLIFGPSFYVHGFLNEENVSHSLILVWTPDVISEYFFQVGQIVTDPNNLPPIADINKRLLVSEAPKYGINQSSYWDEYVESWDDDWQPPLGMNAHGQELLNMLGSTVVQNVTYQTTTSHAPSIKASPVFSCPMAFMIVHVLCILF